MADFLPGTTFKPVIPDTTVDPANVNRVILVSGKLYYDLVKERANRGLEKNVAIIRLEELCPFPFSTLQTVLEPSLKKSSKKTRVVWVQEESQNQGAWPHVMPRLSNILGDVIGWEGRLEYVGREAREVPAVGIGKIHVSEVEEIIRGAFESE
jgi:probable 2-oxoglutarate dehydrogenase E1 component DHKTD1